MGLTDFIREIAEIKNLGKPGGANEWSIVKSQLKATDEEIQIAKQVIEKYAEHYETIAREKPYYDPKWGRPPKSYGPYTHFLRKCEFAINQRLPQYKHNMHIIWNQLPKNLLAFFIKLSYDDKIRREDQCQAFAAYQNRNKYRIHPKVPLSD
jgi:hypothetical protein